MPRARADQAGKPKQPATRRRAEPKAAVGASETSRSASTAADAAATSAGDGPSITVDVSLVKGLARSASRIVSQASTILEEELAAGIGAAKQIEARLLNVAEMRSTNPDEVMARFRRDAHEVVDIVLDLLNVPTRSLGGLANRISVGQPRETTSDQPGSAGLPTITLPGDVPAGGSGAVPFSLENDGDSPTAAFELQATDLVAAGDGTIAAAHVSFEPPALEIAAHRREDVMIKVDVPEGTPPGVYTGLVLATKLDRLRAVLVVSVNE